MSFAFFVVPVRDDGTAATALNAFLGSRRVLLRLVPTLGVGT